MLERGRGRAFPLLVNQILMFLLYPLAVELDLVRLFRLVLVILLVTAVHSLSDRRKHLRVAVALAIPTAITQVAIVVEQSDRLLLLGTTCALLFVSYVTMIVLRAVLSGGEVTSDRIAGAVVVYLFLGLAWAMLYAVLAILQPGAFDAPAALLVGPAAERTEFGFIYYSFVTLTTLGYGEITPVSSAARTLAWLEAVVGQLYVAILVARLVALEIYASRTE